MGYAIYETPLGDAGYGVEDVCHQEGCSEAIDRGLDYLCGDQPGRPSEHGCGRWFCHEHLYDALPLPDQYVTLCRACGEVVEREQAGGQ